MPALTLPNIAAADARPSASPRKRRPSDSTPPGTRSTRSGPEAELFATHTVAQLGTLDADRMKLAVVVTAIKRQVANGQGLSSPG